MREEISWFRRRDALAVSFAVPVIIMIIIFIQRGIFPFGEQSYLRTDLYHQYAPFFSEFKLKLSEGRSLLYSWDVGLGVNFSAIYAYYLASPLNWLIFLCPKKYIIEFMTCMIVGIAMAAVFALLNLRRLSVQKKMGIVDSWPTSWRPTRASPRC